MISEIFQNSKEFRNILVYKCPAVGINQYRPKSIRTHVKKEKQILLRKCRLTHSPPPPPSECDPAIQDLLENQDCVTVYNDN